MVNTKKAVESQYKGVCMVIEQRKYMAGNITKLREVLVKKGIPCRLSYSSAPAAGEAAPASPIMQTAKLFLAPEIQVKAGSKLLVTQNGITTAYQRSGQPVVYGSHQEINLMLFEGWA